MFINPKSKGAVFDIDVPDSDNLVLKNMRCALKVAGLYARIAPRYKDDFLSVALLELVQVCKEIDPDSEDFSKILYRRMCNQCTQFLRKETHQIGSRSTSRYKKTAKVEHLSVDVADVSSDMSELHDFLLALASEPLEAMIIELRLQGYSDREIAEKTISLTMGYVWQLRKDLEIRYKLAERRLEDA